MGIFVKRIDQRRSRRGFTMVELLVVVALLAILIGLLIPAVLTARAAARRSQCQGNLRSIGQALLTFESSHSRFPAGRDQEGLADHSWATHILPYLEEQELYDQYDWRKSWRDMGQAGTWTAPWDVSLIRGPEDGGVAENNFQVAATPLSVFVCPETTHNFPGAMDYGGNYGSSITGLPRGFEHGHGWDSGLLVATNVYFQQHTRRRPIRTAEVADGLSHTFLVFEDAGREAHQGGMWANGHNCLGHELIAINLYRSNSIYSDHGGIAFALLGDGSVVSVTDATDSSVIGAMSTRAGYESNVAYIQ